MKAQSSPWEDFLPVGGFFHDGRIPSLDEDFLTPGGFPGREKRMYECPNCGGNLKFDIPSQQLSCAYCDSRFDPYSVTKLTDAEDGDGFEANVFLCPQCGGEMISGDNDAAAFCSYCGSANILSSRISREKRPRFIIPFQKTKEDCKKAYGRKMRTAVFAPKGFKKPEFIESFRGMYMPYWSYGVSQDGDVKLTGKKSRRKGDYVYTDYYDLTGQLEAGVEGYSHDASSAFYDDISEALAPYDSRGMQEFTPSFLSGFYAETADVGRELYGEEAEAFACDVTFEKLAAERAYRRYEIVEAGSPAKKRRALHARCAGVDSAMFPVWFMAWRKDDLVAYATVNGQTGKVAADLPVDEGKFLLSSLLLAIPLFVLLNLFLTLRPTILLGCSMALALAAAILYDRELKAIYKKETREEDLGLQAKNAGERSTKGTGKGSSGSSLILKVELGCAAAMAVCVAAAVNTSALWLSAVVGMGVVCVKGWGRMRKLKRVKGGYGFLAAGIAVTIAAIIFYVRPVSDLWYYAGGVLILLSVIFILVDLIRNYNRLAMRRPPQFDKRGGDDNA